MRKKIYYLTEGAYSDFTIIGIYEGPEGVDLRGLVAEYRKLHPEQAERWKLNEDAFHAFVVKQSGLVEISASHLWLGWRSLPDCFENDEGRLVRVYE